MAPLPPDASPTLTAIYKSYEAARGDGHRGHLGASEIGEPCDRKLWLSFRWAGAEAFPGRILRLFETGNLEEERLVKDLRAIGCDVRTIDPDTGKQWRETAVDGHFGSSADGAVLGLPEAPKTWHFAEMKTHNDKSFSDLKKKGLRESKPRHYAQVIVGMHLHGFERGVYIAVNKNTDELYLERVYPDEAEALRLVARADRVINADHPLERISRDPSWYQCRFCNFHDQCHGGAFAERNCRTCIHSAPVSGAGWYCARHQRDLTDAEQRVGCGDHLYIPEVVPGEQVDAGDNWIEYKLKDGTTWVDTVE